MNTRIDQAIKVVAAGLRVFVQRGVPLTEDQVQERARNIVAGMTGMEWFFDAVYKEAA